MMMARLTKVRIALALGGNFGVEVLTPVRKKKKEIKSHGRKIKFCSGFADTVGALSLVQDDEIQVLRTLYLRVSTTRLIQKVGDNCAVGFD